MTRRKNCCKKNCCTDEDRIWEGSTAKKIRRQLQLFWIKWKANDQDEDKMDTAVLDKTTSKPSQTLPDWRTILIPRIKEMDIAFHTNLPDEEEIIISVPAAGPFQRNKNYPHTEEISMTWTLRTNTSTSEASFSMKEHHDDTEENLNI